MESPFLTLGMKGPGDEDEIRAAYRRLVKTCHPDRFTDPQEKEEAGKRLIRINQAYEEALKQALPRKHARASVLPENEALVLCRRLLEQNHPHRAMRELSRAETRGADWYDLRGRIQMKLEEYEAANMSFREAIRRDPDNIEYRRGALDAVVALRRSQTLQGKIHRFIRSKKLFKGLKK